MCSRNTCIQPPTCNILKIKFFLWLTGSHPTNQFNNIFFPETALIKQRQLQCTFKQAKTRPIIFFFLSNGNRELIFQGQNHIHVHVYISVGVTTRSQVFNIRNFFYELPLTNPHYIIFIYIVCTFF